MVAGNTVHIQANTANTVNWAGQIRESTAVNLAHSSAGFVPANRGTPVSDSDKLMRGVAGRISSPSTTLTAALGIQF